MHRVVSSLVGPYLQHASLDEQRRAGLLTSFSLVGLVIGGLAAPPHLVAGAAPITYWMWATVALLPLSLVTLRLTRSTSLAAHHFCAAMYLLFTGAIWIGGGVHAPHFVSMPVVILAGYMVGGGRAGMVWGIATVATLVAFLAYTRLVGPVEGLVSAASVVSGREQEPIPVALGVLAMAYFFERSRARAFEAAEAAKLRAEHAHASIRHLLDNTGQGFVYLNPAGEVAQEASRVASEWLGDIHEGLRFSEVLRRFGPTTADTFALGWSQLVEGSLPRELCVAQLPRCIEVGQRHLDLTYRTLPEDEEMPLTAVVVIITDVSAQRMAERAEARQRDLMSAFDRIRSSPAIFQEFLATTQDLLDDLSRADQVQRQLVHLHTLKGNTAVFGVMAISNLSHRLESLALEQGRPLCEAQLAELVREWTEFVEEVQPFCAPDADAFVQLDVATYESHLSRIEAGVQHADLAAEVQLWRLEPIHQRLNVLARTGQELARRLGKGEIQVDCHSNGLWVDPKPLQGFWSTLVHLVRNCVDHGLELPAQRIAAGKTPAGRLSLEAQQRDGMLVVEVVDDGRGIDWEAIRAKAKDQGLAAHTQQDLIAALFQEGLSTRDEVTATSGRGVGTSAVRHALQALGGNIEVDSEPGTGTRVRCSIPAHRIAMGGVGASNVQAA